MLVALPRIKPRHLPESFPEIFDTFCIYLSRYLYDVLYHAGYVLRSVVYIHKNIRLLELGIIQCSMGPSFVKCCRNKMLRTRISLLSSRSDVWFSRSLSKFGQFSRRFKYKIFVFKIMIKRTLWAEKSLFSSYTRLYRLIGLKSTHFAYYRLTEPKIAQNGSLEGSLDKLGSNRLIV